jgi:hypothetical protein
MITERKNAGKLYYLIRISFKKKEASYNTDGQTGNASGHDCSPSFLTTSQWTKVIWEPRKEEVFPK